MELFKTLHRLLTISIISDLDILKTLLTFQHYNICNDPKTQKTFEFLALQPPE